MATVKLTIEIEDDDISKQMMEDGFLKMIPMPQIPDPNWVDPKDGTEHPEVDEFPSTKALAEDRMGEWLIRIINKGLVLISQEDKQVFKKSMILKG